MIRRTACGTGNLARYARRAPSRGDGGAHAGHQNVSDCTCASCAPNRGCPCICGSPHKNGFRASPRRIDQDRLPIIEPLSIQRGLSTLSAPARAEADAGAPNAARTAGAFRHGGGSAARRGPGSGSDGSARRAFGRASGRHPFPSVKICAYFGTRLVQSGVCEPVRARGSDPRQRGGLRICVVDGGLAAPG